MGDEAREAEAVDRLKTWIYQAGSAVVAVLKKHPESRPAIEALILNSDRTAQVADEVERLQRLADNLQQRRDLLTKAHRDAATLFDRLPLAKDILPWK